MHGYHGNFITISKLIKSSGEFLFQQELYRNQSIDWQCKAIEWFLYNIFLLKRNFQKDFS